MRWRSGPSDTPQYSLTSVSQLLSCMNVTILTKAALWTSSHKGTAHYGEQEADLSLINLGTTITGNLCKDKWQVWSCR